MQGHIRDNYEGTPKYSVCRKSTPHSQHEVESNDYEEGYICIGSKR